MKSMTGAASFPAWRGAESANVVRSRVALDARDRPPLAAWDAVDTTLDASFPASDPPSWTLGRASSSWRTANESAAPWLMLHGRSGGTGDAGGITPSLKGTVTGGTVIVGGQEVATKLEEVMDLAVAGEEPLGVPRRLEALHLPFSSSCRLV